MLIASVDPRFTSVVSRHVPALEREPARHNLILGLLERIQSQRLANACFWSFAVPGSCALQLGTNNIVLGELAREDMETLASSVAGLRYGGIVGPGAEATLVAEALVRRGVAFEPPIAQMIHQLDRPPRYPDAKGRARAVTSDDLATFSDYFLAFGREAVPHDPVPTPEQLATTAASGRYLFWMVDGQPVSMAGQVRETSAMAAIAAVYTPPAHRSKGYAGSVTAALCDKIFASGRKLACLYTNLANPYSNRCYAKIGFVPACQSFHYVRKLP